jgi:hypothetical protein
VLELELAGLLSPVAGRQLAGTRLGVQQVAPEAAARQQEFRVRVMVSVCACEKRDIALQDNSNLQRAAVAMGRDLAAAEEWEPFVVLAPLREPTKDKR